MFIGRHRPRRGGDIRRSTAIVRKASVPGGCCRAQVCRAAESLHDSQSETGETIAHADQVQRAHGAYRQGTFIITFTKSFASILVTFARVK